MELKLVHQQGQFIKTFTSVKKVEFDRPGERSPE